LYNFNVSYFYSAKITGNPQVKMNYVHFFESFVIPYKINVVGWPTKFVNPSELSDSIPPLLELRDCLVEGSCYFKKLSEREFRELADKHQKAVDAGKILPMKRKVRKDKNTETESSTQTKKTRTAKKQVNAKKSAAIIESDSESDDVSDGGDEEEEAGGDEGGNAVAPSQTRSQRKAANVSHSAVSSESQSHTAMTLATPSSTSPTTTSAPPARSESSLSGTPSTSASPSTTEISASSTRLPLGDITRTPSVNQAPPSTTTVPASDLPAKRIRHAPVRFGWDYPEDGVDSESGKRPAKKRKSQK
jgi:hypothetical protein